MIVTSTNVEGALGDNHVVLNDGNNVFFDNELVETNENISNNAIESSSDDTIWYFKESIKGSVNTDYADVTTCMLLLIGVFSAPAATCLSIATWFVGHNLPYLWYERITLWDQAPYRPLYWISITTYSDAKMTIQETYDDYYL
ncbi:hypothetical protein [Paenibacillus macerans]|uniref:hypothetical protein n=1 Tax=Paenibacillus macerans TaxID=44252 RepID=UPI003D3128A3